MRDRLSSLFHLPAAASTARCEVIDDQADAAHAVALLAEDSEPVELDVRCVASADPAQRVELLENPSVPFSRRRCHRAIIRRKGQFQVGFIVLIAAAFIVPASEGASGRRATPLLDKRTRLYAQVVTACVKTGPAARTLVVEGADPTGTASGLLSAISSCTTASGLLHQIPSGEFAQGAHFGSAGIVQTLVALRSYVRYLDTKAPSQQARAQNALAAAQFARNRMLRLINRVRAAAHLSRL